MAPSKASVDNRTRGQKAADTRKANREAEARRDELKSQKLAPRQAKENARQVWQGAATSKKRPLNDSEPSEAVPTKHTKNGGSDTISDNEMGVEDKEEKGDSDPLGIQEFLQQYPPAFLSSESEDSAVFPGFRCKVGDGTAKPRALPAAKRVHDSSESDSDSNALQGRDDSDDDNVSTDDDKLTAQGPTRVRAILNAEHPTFESSRTAATLFNDDSDDDQVGQGVNRARNTTVDMSNSAPPVAKTEARRKPLADIEVPGARQSKSRRQENHDLEKPRWNENTVKPSQPQSRKSHRQLGTNGQRGVNGQPVANGNWSPAATIVYPLRGKVKLLDQHAELQAVVRGGIKEAIRRTISKNAFPTINSQTEYARSVLIVGANEYAAHEIKRRLKTDSGFVRDLEELVMARITILRKELKDAATKTVVADYNLPVHDKEATKNAVKTLLEADKYIFANPKGTKDPDFTKPYAHPAIVNILRNTVFNTCTSVGMRNLDLFQSNHRDHDEAEVPHALVALVATTIYFALSEWRHGERINADFQLSAHEDVYYSQIETLKTIQNDKAMALHRILSQAYEDAIGFNTPSTSESRESALAVLDLAGMEED